MLKRSSAVAVSDFIVTSGEGGIFPQGLIVGNIEQVTQDPHDISLYAVLTPVADIQNLRSVMVITAFDGQGGITGP